MEFFEWLFLHFSALHKAIAYGIVFLGMIIEGEVVLMLSGIMVKGGALGFLNTLLVATAGVLAHDSLFWLVGRRLTKEKDRKFFNYGVEDLEPFMKKIKRNDFFIFFSKFLWNFNRFVLVSAGYLGTPYKKLLKYSISAGIIWGIVFISLGYIFAEQIEITQRRVETAILFFTILIVALVLLENSIKKVFTRNGHNNTDCPENKQGA